MSMVECCDRLLVESFGCSYHGGVDRPQWQIAVLVDELGDAEPVGCGNWFDADITARKVAEEANLGVGSESGAD